MLHELLTKYLKEVEIAVRELNGAYTELYEEEILTADRINLRIRIRFHNGNLLEINEAIIVNKAGIMQLGYRYHYQDERNNMIFRYDNTPHFPKLDTFPHHKHLVNDVVESSAPSTMTVISEASSHATAQEESNGH